MQIKRWKFNTELLFAADCGQRRNQAGTAAGFTAIQRHRAPVDCPAGVTFDNKTGLMAGDRADTHIADSGDRFSEGVVIGCSSNDATAMIGGVAKTYDVFHRQSLSEMQCGSERCGGFQKINALMKALNRCLEYLKRSGNSGSDGLEICE